MAKSKVKKAAKITVSNKAGKKSQAKFKPMAVALKADSKLSKLVNTNEAASILGCSVPLIYAMLRDGRLKKKENIEGRNFCDRDELQAVKDSGIVVPRKRNTQSTIPQAIMRSKNQIATFEVSAPAGDVNYLSMVLAAQGLTITDWVTKMIIHTAAEAQAGAASRLSAVAGS